MLVEVDGSMLEGGGQILRMAVAISAVTKIPVSIFNIRAKRRDPGLKAQHATAIRAVARLVDADVDGLALGARELLFKPKAIRGGEFRFDVGTAGSTTLVLQSLLPAAAFAPSTVRVEVKGGTDNPLAPPIDYLSNVLRPLIDMMGYRFEVNTIKRGFYPRGGGIIRSSMTPVPKLSPLRIEDQGIVKIVKGVSHSSMLPSHVAQRMAESARRVLANRGYDVDIAIEVLQPEHPKCALNPGCGIVLWAETTKGAVVGADSLGEVGKPAEVVGEEAARRLINEIEGGATIDVHAADQLVVYMALAEGESVVKVSELSMHALTCIELSKKLMRGVKFEVKEGRPTTLRCRGVGLKNEYMA
ncbi:MAG: RNA 3'-terminal phosphate cyclase [Candidatus Nezhaarchaeota archaeon]|nr:RNA 3'-terminal phosphate cyclase [Candidatus Nezhaarchaeota archaeon]